MKQTILLLLFSWLLSLSYAAEQSSIPKYVLNLPDNQQIQLLPVTMENGAIFWMSECEVTQEQYVALIHARVWESAKNLEEAKTWFNEPYKNMKSFMKRMHVPSVQMKSLPMHSVSWDEAFAWCEMLNMYVKSKEEADLKEMVTKNYVIRLPTVKEWRSACGDDNKNTVSWYSQNSSGTPHPVKAKEANSLGFYDLLGNVSEWTTDAMRPNGLPYWTGPRGFSYHKTVAALQRIHIGGSWKTNIVDCNPKLLTERSAARLVVLRTGIETNTIEERYIQGFKSKEIGFRIVFAAPLQ